MTNADRWMKSLRDLGGFVTDRLFGQFLCDFPDFSIAVEDVVPNSARIAVRTPLARHSWTLARLSGGDETVVFRWSHDGTERARSLPVMPDANSIDALVDSLQQELREEVYHVLSDQARKELSDALGAQAVVPRTAALTELVVTNPGGVPVAGFSLFMDGLHVWVAQPGSDAEKASLVFRPSPFTAEAVARILRSAVEAWR